MSGEKAWICPNCGLAAARNPAMSVSMLWPFLYQSSSYGTAGMGHLERKRRDAALTWTGLRVDTCQSCEKTSTYLLHFRRHLPDKPGVERSKWKVTSEERLISPRQTPRQLAPEAPAAVRSLFNEASLCENAGAMRGAGVLLRAAVEELVKDRGGEGRNLYDKIESVSGELGEDLTTDLHEARLLGNDSIHEGLAYSAEEVADVAELIVEAVTLIYVQPEERRRMREQRKARRTGGTP